VIFEYIQQPDGKLKADRVEFLDSPSPAMTRPLPMAMPMATPMPSSSRPSGPQAPHFAPSQALASQGVKSRPEAPPAEAVAVLLTACAAAGSLPGVVKSGTSTYGFIQVPGIPIDIMFRASQISDSVRPGDHVKFVVQEGQDGRLQATQVILASAARHSAVGRTMGVVSRKRTLPDAVVHEAKQPRTMSTGVREIGTIKSFNPVKGWGMICGDGVDDRFFMSSELPPEMRTKEAAGVMVEYELMQTNEGKFRARSIVCAV